jgi:N-acetylmuramoyl-L-alanine amidase
MRKINSIIVHCSATPEGRDVNIETIRGWHVNERGWSDIGYHYVIELDGAIKKGRPINVQGAHTKGHNKDSIGICYVGGTEQDINIPKDTRTDAQKESLTKLLLELKTSDYCDAVIYGHRDFASKACPSFDAKKEYKYISDYYGGQ